ncbi:MAG TPA: asparagine synthase (glutamine-hydrolyzing) [Candidatus Acidoferrales bacterium]|nr:asparagine synthase (glutamine-hydrolyzing) [Candidatus Acidoferrales bacterium]
MCGICGAIGFDSQPEAVERARRMMSAMIHRGPDGEGMFAVRRAVLGMRRLSIIDLAGGNQPIRNESGTLAVVFNGEIYNFRELRRLLESAGHVFRTQSDTEVIVHAYESWGEDCVRHLRGMFAFAILEMPAGRAGPPRRVFLARDRLGIKPLYYAARGEKFIFASEVRALLASGCLSPQISPSSVSSYLLFGSVGEPETLVNGAFSLPPGHCGFISCDLPSESFSPIAYWGLRDTIVSKSDASRNTTPHLQLKESLEESVRCHLEADVPLGIFLSSGIDSTAIAAIASREQSNIRTFTVIFPEQEFSEVHLARRTARRLGTDHSELLLTGEDVYTRLDDAIGAFDQPSMDGVNTFFVSWAAHQAGLKVALSGLGSDEFFGGYETFHSVPKLARLTAVSRGLPVPMRKAAAHLVQAIAAQGLQPDAARKLASSFSSPADFPHPYFFTRSLFPPHLAAAMLRANLGAPQSLLWMDWLDRNARDTASLDSFNAVSWLETRSYLVNTLLRDTDTMSMRHSLEVRVPFLDHPLAEWALRLPAAAKKKNGARKALLIEALGDLLPEEIVKQRKRTFTLPWENWLRGPLRTRVESSLSNLSPTLGALIEPTAVKNVWHDFLGGQTSWSRPWSLFVLNEWTQRNLESVSQYSSQEETKVAQAAS